jgi:hypothetical protein
MKTTIYEDPKACRLVWEKMWPVKGLFDLWQVRSCFHDAFTRPLKFIVVEDKNKLAGFLALSWDEQEKKYVQFPGETWHGKTWLEQNRVIASSPEVLQALLDAVPGSLNLRYLNWSPLLDFTGLTKIDEVGYLFYPGLFDFDFDNYWLSFSGKSRKKLKNDLKKIEAGSVAYRFNRHEDLDRLFQMNLEAFGEDSYFSEALFHRSFESLAVFLEKMGMLRVTTVMVGGRIAAVDMGAIWKNSYTLLAGGTHPEFPGIAKLINLHHMEWSCSQKFDTVDFLCGNFNWKERFHLTPRPLYELSLDRDAASYGRTHIHEPRVVCA